jgi:hypothetical protein
MKVFATILCLLVLGLGLGALVGSRTNKHGRALALSICSAAKPGTRIDQLKAKFSKPRDQLQLSTSPSDILFVAPGFGPYIFMCKVGVANGVVVNARYSEDS